MCNFNMDIEVTSIVGSVNAASLMDNQDGVGSNLERLALLKYQKTDQARVICKGVYEPRLSSRRKYHNKLQRFDSQSIDSLDLAYDDNGLNTLLHSSGYNGVNRTVISKCSISTSESATAVDINCCGSDYATGGSYEGSRTISCTLDSDGSIDYVDALPLSQRDPALPNDIYYKSISNISDANELFRQGSLGTVQSFPSIAHSHLSDILEQDIDACSLFMESDTESYCQTDRQYDNSRFVKAESDYISDVVDNTSDNNHAQVPDTRRYTYSPESQLGVLRLFFHQEGTPNRLIDSSYIPSRIVINTSPFVIGTDSSCDLVFDNERLRNIAARHCSIELSRCTDVDPDLSGLGICAFEVEVALLQPDATLLINGVLVKSRAKLFDGDIISFGPRHLSVSYSVAFRTKESCIALLNQLNSLMLTPSAGVRSQPSGERSPGGDLSCSPSLSILRTSCTGDVDYHVNVAIFEQYYGEPSVVGNLSQDWDALSCGYSQDGNFSVSQTPYSHSGLYESSELEIVNCSFPSTPYGSQLVGIHTPSSSFLYAGLSQGNMVSQLSEQRSPYSSLRAELEACNLNEVKQVPENIDDDSVLNGKLLFSAYANSLESTGILDGNHTAILDHVSDETRTKLEAAKIARLRSLNKTSVPIVVDTSRTLSSQESENCLTVSKLRFVGVVPASYQTTLEELLPRITGLLRGNVEQSPSSLRDVLCDYEVLTKRRGKPLSEDECQYNWVFQLDFFDRDDPLFRRAVYTSHRIIESDRSRLRSAVSYTIQQLERSRVLYIQMRF